MVPPAASSKKKSIRDEADEVAARVSRYREAGESALERGDANRAVAAFRMALGAAPFSRDLKDLFEEALYEQVLAAEEGRAPKQAHSPRRAGKPAAMDVIGIEEEEEEVEAAPPPPRRKKRQSRPRASRLTIPPAWRPVLGGLRLGVIGLLALALTGGALYGINRSLIWVGGVFSVEAALPELATVTLPDEIQAMTDRATALLREGKPEEAVKVLRAGMEEHPVHAGSLSPGLVTALRVKAGSEYRSRRFEQAASLYQEASEIDPRNPDNWIDLGLALLQQARSAGGTAEISGKRQLLQRAEEAFKHSLELHPSSSSALFGLAEAYAAANERTKAAETYERVLAAAPESPEGMQAERALLQLRRR